MKKMFLMMLGVLMLAGCQESMDERCAREAKEYTKKKCPAVITTGVTIDSLIFYADSRTLTYYYTVEGILDDIEVIKSHDLHGMMLKELRNSASMKDYKEAGYNFRYVFWSTKNEGTRLYEATFRKKDYQ